MDTAAHAGADAGAAVDDPGPGAPGRDAPLIVLVDVTTEVERALVADHLRETGLRPTEVVPLRAAALAQVLTDAAPGA
ncbi:MAG TPA: hypothetical protein VD813_15550, partial [Pseudonocardia sp.]|nr:hypothetical protein [Pseudonocardia sp.]